MNWSKK
jgi:hypothetical protein